MTASASGTPGSDHRYNGVNVYILRFDKLRPGDIILMRNRHGKRVLDRLRSVLIALWTRGRFSHAAICTMLPTAIEALPNGVSNFTLANTFFHDPRNIRVLRYADPQLAARAGDKASWFLGQAYSVPLAVLSVLPRGFAPKTVLPATFCSALVAAAFVGGRAPEFATLNPFKIWPATIERMRFLEDITDQVSTRILAPSNIEKMSALDGDRILSPFSPQAKVLRTLFESIAPTVTALVTTYGLKTKLPTSFFEAFTIVTDSSNWCCNNRIPEATQFAAAVKAADIKLRAEMVGSGLIELLEAGLSIDRQEMAEIVARAQHPDRDIDLDHLEMTLTNTYGQIESRLATIEPPRCRPGISASWDLWEELTRKSVKNIMERRDTVERVLATLAPARIERARSEHKARPKP